jgi:hypothetical protein
MATPQNNNNNNKIECIKCNRSFKENNIVVDEDTLLEYCENCFIKHERSIAKEIGKAYMEKMEFSKQHFEY